MKRVATSYIPRINVYDIRKKLKESHLADMAATLLAYNEIEAEVDILLAHILQLEAPLEVTSRINGFEGKVEIIKAAAKTLSAPTEFIELLTASLGDDDGVLKLKQYRDALAHARHIDIATAAIAATTAKRGKAYEVLIAPGALMALYIRLLLMRPELLVAETVIIKLVILRQFNRYETGMERGFIASPAQPVIPTAKQRYEQDVPILIAQYQEHQNRRRSLPQFPRFPSEGELFEAHLKWVQARLDSQAT